MSTVAALPEKNGPLVSWRVGALGPHREHHTRPAAYCDDFIAEHGWPPNSPNQLQYTTLGVA